MQLLLRPGIAHPEVEARNLDYSPLDSLSCQTLTLTSSTAVAAALGFSRRERRAFFIQKCLFRHVRRFLIVLDSAHWEAHLLGTLPRFRSCWRALSTPSMEFFNHPITSELLADVGVARRRLRRGGSLSVWIDAVFDESNWLPLGEEDAVSLASQVGKLRDACQRSLSKHLRTRRHWYRHLLV